jgi:hypothetical protein
MKASQLWNMQQVHNRELTQKHGLTASVMDYPSPNIALDKTKQGDYFTSRPGPYDLWAIEFGYSEGDDDPAREEARLATILDRSTDSTLIFGNDADDMRSPGKAIDPRVNINDMSSDAISYSVDRLKLANQMLGKIKEKYSKEGESYQEVRQAYAMLAGEWTNCTATISRYVGGVYVDHSKHGQKSAAKPLVPVDYKDQKRAMQALNTYLFSPSAFTANADLYSHLQVQRRGFQFLRSSEDPKLHDRFIAVQGNALSHLLHPNTLKRMTDSRLYGNKYTVMEMMNDLTNACFREDQAGNVSPVRQNLQIDYVRRLVNVAVPKETSGTDYVSRSAALAQLKSIRRMASQPNPAASSETTAHREHIALLIDKALSKD